MLLFLTALPLARRAQRVASTRLPDVVAEMGRWRVFSFEFLVLSSPRPPGVGKVERQAAGADVDVGIGVRGSEAQDIDAERVARAAGRATARWARWFGGLDTCLTRSLVAGFGCGSAF